MIGHKDGHTDGTLYRVTVRDGDKIKIVGLLTFEGATLFLKHMAGDFDMVTMTREMIDTPNYKFFGGSGFDDKR